jgi:K+-transporting ATPase KdpF subunit
VVQFLSAVERNNEHGPDHLVAGNVSLGVGDIRLDVRLRPCLRQGMKGSDMGVLTWLTAAVTVLLLVYLFAALVRPEWF